MGLIYIRMRFQNLPPTEDVFREKLERQVGSSSGLDSFTVKGNVLEITLSLDAVIEAYALKILLDLGGEHDDPLGGPPRDYHLPTFVQKPWRDWPWWKRLRIYAGVYIGSLSMSGLEEKKK